MAQLQVDLVKKMTKIDRCFGYEGLANKIILRSQKAEGKRNKNKKFSYFPRNNYDNITHTFVAILSP